jgi:hypothetical protein
MRNHELRLVAPATAPLSPVTVGPAGINGAGARIGIGSGVGVGVGLDLDPYTDPSHHPTGQVHSTVTGRASAPTDPCLGVSRWGEDAYARR